MPDVLNGNLPTERHSFQMVGVSAVGITGTVNTAVVAFNGVPTLKWGTRYVTNTSSVAPVAGFGQWVNIVNSPTLGTTFKFVQRGIYRFDVTMPTGPSDPDVLGYNVGLTLDSAAANLLATTNMQPDDVGATGFQSVIAWAVGSIPVGSSQSINLGGTVCITDEQARYDDAALPQPVAGATGIGVVRLHANDNAGGLAVAQFAGGLDISLWCNYVGDLAG